MGFPSGVPPPPSGRSAIPAEGQSAYLEGRGEGTALFLHPVSLGGGGGRKETNPRVNSLPGPAASCARAGAWRRGDPAWHRSARARWDGGEGKSAGPAAAPRLRRNPGPGGPQMWPRTSHGDPDRVGTLQSLALFQTNPPPSLC